MCTVLPAAVWVQRKPGQLLFAFRAPFHTPYPCWLWYLYPSDDGMVHPAHVGQRGALHLDLHSLDGPCRAQIGHSYLQHMRP